MARSLNPPTPAAPYLARWTTAAFGANNIDVTSVVADSAPVELPASNILGPMLTIICAATISTANPEWHLLFEDEALRGVTPAGDDYAIVAAISAISATTPTARQMSRDGESGGTDIFIHVPIQFDLRGLPNTPKGHLYLACVDMGGAGDRYLVHYGGDGRAL